MHALCSICSNTFFCGAHDAKNPCWCTKKPAVPIEDNVSCRCESCLDAMAHKGVSSCFRLHVAYVGGAFAGFQQQALVRTVEGELKAALKKITSNDIKLITAGRTDAGVHARGQVVSIEFVTKLTSRQLTLALASLLPKDMAVYRIDPMPLGFDARRHSIGKQYIYRIYQGLVADPFLCNQALHVRPPLDVEKMAMAAQYFIGEHNFASFRSSLCTAAHAVRYVWHVGVTQQGSLIQIDVRGNAFCLNMVRIMAGTLIEVGRGARPPSSIKEALLNHDRRLAGITAKAHGLTFERVYYPDDCADAAIPPHARFPRFPVSKESWPFAPGFSS